MNTETCLIQKFLFHQTNENVIMIHTILWKKQLTIFLYEFCNKISNRKYPYLSKTLY